MPAWMPKMRMWGAATLLLALGIHAGTALAAPRPDPADAALSTTLRSMDQALLDAIAPGRRDVWDQALAPGAIYIDENGTVMDRATYLASLAPLPPGATGHLAIVDYRLQRLGDIAVVVHRDAEQESYHGISLHADYLMSETWLRLGAAWRLALVHVHVMAVDPPQVRLSAAALDAYAGTYRAGTDLCFVIRRQGNQLLSGRQGRPPQPLLAEAPDLLFTPGEPRVRRLFLRDAGGHVTGFIDRREGEDIVWHKVVATSSGNPPSIRPPGTRTATSSLLRARIMIASSYSPMTAAAPRQSAAR